MSAFFRSLFQNFALSFKSIKTVRVIVFTSLFTAIGVVLELFTNFSLLGGAVQVKLSFIPIGICGMMFGPAPAMLCAFLTDFLRATVFPTGAYIPTLSLCQAVMGLIYGVCFYRSKITTLKVTLTTLVNFFVVTLLLKSLCLAPIYYTGDILLTLKLRLWYALLIPVEIVAFKVLSAPLLKTLIKK